MSADLAQKEIALISFVGNLAKIGDIIDRNLTEPARKKPDQVRRFSGAGEMALIAARMIRERVSRDRAGGPFADQAG